MPTSIHLYTGSSPAVSRSEGWSLARLSAYVINKMNSRSYSDDDDGSSEDDGGMQGRHQ